MTVRTRMLVPLAVSFALVAASTLGVTVTSAAATSSDSSSAVTKKGEGPFSGLTVSVGQTRNLIDQVVKISWSGGGATTPGSGQFATNYLQIMQCWGDDPDGPSREQCQFGAFIGDNRGGNYSASRQLNYSEVTDPLETIKPDPGSLANVFAPFRSVTGKVETKGLSEFFDANSSNEDPFAITRSNGTGEQFFTVQTLADAPGLGCGEPKTVAGVTKGRSCWLVVVPRNDREVDGSLRSASGTNRLVSSPLSATNWSHRITFPLSFEPVGRPCPLGSAERKTLGQENAAEAVRRWQPALCADGGPVFSYSQVSDDIARRELITSDPGLGFVSEPLAADALPDGRSAVYAPVALSGVTIGFNVESQSTSRAPADIKARDGERITSLKLTPRLVAKLLTQSYTRAAFVDAPSVAGNPTDLTKDPEFQAINPNLDGLRLSLPEVLIPLGRRDVTELVWRWLQSDADAKAFLGGKADQWGMKINTNYKSLELPRPDFPKSETYCIEYVDGRPPLCSLDFHPYVADMQDGAKSAARGDTQAKVVWDPTILPPAWRKDRPQPSGSRSILAITDTASAERYGLETAQVRNAGGSFVAPTVDSMTKAAASMKPGPNPTVLRADPTAKDAKAYPLTTLSYAVTVPQVLDSQAKREYAAFLTYAVQSGQELGLEPGDLPYGYAPLPKSAVDRTLQVAKALKTPTNADDEVVAAGSSNQGNGSPSSSASGAGSTSGSAPATTPDAGSGDKGSGTGVVDVALVTPADSAGAGRLLPIVALVLGLLAAMAGPVLLRFSRMP